MAIRAFDAAINGVGCVAELVLGEKADDLSIVCSASSGAYFEVDGNTDWHGYYVRYGATPDYYPNDTFTLAFNLNQEVGKGGSGEVMVEAVRIDWDFVSGAPIRHLVKFGANGAYTPGVQTVTDAGPPQPKPSRDASIEVGVAAASPTMAALTGIRNASLLFYADIIPYADSGTAGIYKRAAGPFGWEFTVDMHVEEAAYPATIVGLNGNSEVHAYIDDKDYFAIKWVKWKNLGELKVPVQGREYVTNRFVGKGAAFVPIADTWTKGSATKPGGTTGDIWGGV